MRYQHQPLPTPEDSSDIYIRLVVLAEGPKTGPLHCHIIQTLLSQAPEYETVSYCWGDGKDQNEIFIDALSESSATHSSNNATSLPLLVPNSLTPFLYRTRARGIDRTLWIDSICINQSDDLEKNQQVARMRSIYIRATHTLCWLGPEADSSDIGLTYVSVLGQRLYREEAAAAQGDSAPQPEKREDDQVTVRPGLRALEAMLKLLDRPYFERAWICQEVIVSGEAFIVCGNLSIQWKFFICGFLYLLMLHSWVFEFYAGQRLSLLISLRYSQMEWEAKTDVEWWRTLLRHRSSSAGNPRDKVFAYLGLRSKSMFEELGITPDYRASVEDVYGLVATKALSMGHVEVLSVPRLVVEGVQGIEQLRMPSWVPDWRWTEKTPLSLTKWEENETLQLRLTYSASADSTFTPSFDRQPEQTMTRRWKLPRQLRIRGYSVAQITRLTRAWATDNPSGSNTALEQARVLQANQVQIGEWESVFRISETSARYVPTGETKKQAFYRTVTAGTLLHNSEAETEAAVSGFESRQRIFRVLAMLGLYHFLWVYVLFVLIDRQLRKRFGFENPEWRFRTIVLAMANRKGAILAGEDTREYVGLVPGIAKLGDWVFICEGVKAPLVLREKDAVPGGKKEWEFVGDCYVHGMMKGELWTSGRVSEDICIV
ncbi:heterokaryon incompatibility protein-domain-containing protein [Massariosphaeria phaeospora]|uniref:Heterokaryon incompatibility protein-domain-containing protein n=1 Tax=Massariosphaeria phaeospora TaxID=100035 RepID=A0A7C8MF14_9PLEO|nr:heterokaryon incompatibility protein-domain-containing protein [Massariosphaeria phaeospora]